MTMIERVARAIYSEFENRPAYAQEQMNDALATELARAAIQAMREPTEGMRLAALTTDLPYAGDPPFYEKIYLAMIDAALNEEH